MEKLINKKLNKEKMVIGAPKAGRFMENEDGTMTDLSTHLMWEPPASHLHASWYEGREYAQSLRVASYSDWRLPTIEELETMARVATRVAKEELPGLWRYSFWSSSHDTGKEEHAYQYNFDDGCSVSTPKNGVCHVRCVRNVRK